MTQLGVQRKACFCDNLSVLSSECAWVVSEEKAWRVWSLIPQLIRVHGWSETLKATYCMNSKDIVIINVKLRSFQCVRVCVQLNRTCVPAHEPRWRPKGVPCPRWCCSCDAADTSRRRATGPESHRACWWLHRCPSWEKKERWHGSQNTRLGAGFHTLPVANCLLITCRIDFQLN